MKEMNADLTTELARYKGKEKSFEINKAKFHELKTGYRKFVYQELCLTKKINALYLSSDKQITALNEEISNLNNQLSKEKSIVSLFQEENKKLKSDFKTREDEFLDKQIQYEKKTKELDNILVKTGYQNPFYLKQAQQKQQSLYNGRVLLKKHDPPAVYDSEEPLQLAQESYINKWSSPAYQEFHKIIKNEIAPIVNQVDARVQNFETHFMKEATKFVQDFKSLVKEAGEFLDKISVLEKENERLLRAVVSQHIMSIVQSPSVVETSKLQTELERVESTAKTRRPQPRSNPNNDSIPSASKSICLSNNLEKVEEHHKNLQFSKTPNHRSSEGNNVNDMNSRKKNQNAKVLNTANQKKHKAIVNKSKKLGSEERLASPRPSKPRTCLRWLPTERIFDLCGKITASSFTESESDTSVYDNERASNPQEPTSKGFPNSTSFLGRFTIYPLAVL
ncbi:hypothetical protein Tco_0569828 [Tanacetum coccineum]